MSRERFPLTLRVLFCTLEGVLYIIFLRHSWLFFIMINIRINATRVTINGINTKRQRTITLYIRYWEFALSCSFGANQTNCTRDIDMADIQTENSTLRILGLVTKDTYLKGAEIFRYLSMTAHARCKIVEIASPRWQISIAIQICSELESYTKLHAITRGITKIPDSRSLAAKLRRNKLVFVRKNFIFHAKTSTRLFATVIKRAVIPRNVKITLVSVSSVRSSKVSSAEKFCRVKFSVKLFIFLIFWWTSQNSNRFLCYEGRNLCCFLCFCPFPVDIKM